MTWFHLKCLNQWKFAHIYIDSFSTSLNIYIISQRRSMYIWPILLRSTYMCHMTWCILVDHIVLANTQENVTRASSVASVGSQDRANRANQMSVSNWTWPIKIFIVKRALALEFFAKKIVGRRKFESHDSYSDDIPFMCVVRPAEWWCGASYVVSWMVWRLSIIMDLELLDVAAVPWLQLYAYQSCPHITTCPTIIRVQLMIWFFLCNNFTFTAP